MQERPTIQRCGLAGAFVVLVLVTTMAQAAGSTFVQHDPPSAKDALRLAFHNAALPLPDASCLGVDTSGLPDPTLGDWLAGILAALEPAAGTSGVSAACDGALGALSCRVHVNRQAGEEVWTWGVRFAADGHSGLIDPASIVCDASG